MNKVILFLITIDINFHMLHPSDTPPLCSQTPEWRSGTATPHSHAMSHSASVEHTDQLPRHARAQQYNPYSSTDTIDTQDQTEQDKIDFYTNPDMPKSHVINTARNFNIPPAYTTSSPIVHCHAFSDNDDDFDDCEHELPNASLKKFSQSFHTPSDQSGSTTLSHSTLARHSATSSPSQQLTASRSPEQNLNLSDFIKSLTINSLTQQASNIDPLDVLQENISSKPSNIALLVPILSPQQCENNDHWTLQASLPYTTSHRLWTPQQQTQTHNRHIPQSLKNSATNSKTHHPAQQQKSCLPKKESFGQTSMDSLSSIGSKAPSTCSQASRAETIEDDVFIDITQAHGEISNHAATTIQIFIRKNFLKTNPLQLTPQPQNLARLSEQEYAATMIQRFVKKLKTYKKMLRLLHYLQELRVQHYNVKK